MKNSQRDRIYLINMYNATSTEHPEGSGEIETYEHWLEGQLLHRLDIIDLQQQEIADLETELENTKYE